LDQNISSYLILFNADKVAHSVGIFAYPENAAQVTKRVMIDPNQTMALDIGSLFVESPNSTGSKADPGKPSTSKPKGDGIVTWLSLEGNNIFGRVVQISANQAWSRNFSCPVEYIACAATVFPSSTTLSVGTSAPLYGYANICPSSGQCTCDGSGSCTYTTQQVSTNVWSVDNSAIASFSGSVYNQSATIVGNQAGQTNVQLNVQDDSDYACFGSTTMAYGNPGALTVTVCPSTILYTQSVTPSLSSNDPPYLTGMGIVAVMTGSAGSAGAQISEAVSLQSSTCGPNYQIDCGGSPAVAIASGGPVPFQGTVLPGVTDGFYDVHEAVNTIDVLGTLGLNSCTFTCIQTYSCQGAPLGKFSIQYNLNHGNGVTNVTATKTATN
jgi:hypothetical protein